MTLRDAWASAPLLALLIAPIPLQAGTGDIIQPSLHPYLDRRHTLIAGILYQEVVAEVRKTVDPLPRQTLNVGHLGVDETDTSWYLEYRYRFSEKWGLVASAQNFSSQGSIGPHRKFNFNGVEFPATAGVHTKIGVDTYVVDVLYSVYRSNRAELSLGGGIHAFDFEVDITGTALAGRNKGEKSFAASDLLAPLPNLRAQVFYAFSPRWAVLGAFGWLSADIDEWNGDFTYLSARAHYLFSDRFGVSLGYQFTDVDVSRKQQRQSSEYDIEFKGPTLQLSLGF
jgi:hypothetical protein